MLLTVVLFVSFVCIGRADKWSQLDALLQQGVTDGVFPGAVGAVGTASGYLYRKAVGKFTYGLFPPRDPASVPPMTLGTAFDMASCSKVMGATTAGAILYQQGHFSLTDFVSQYLGDEFNANNKSGIQIVHLLTHDAGFPPDPIPGYWERRFGCPESQLYHPRQRMSCTQRIFESVLNQTLDRPPGIEYVYSDLSFITMHFVIGQIVYSKQLVPPSSLRVECASFDVKTNRGGVLTCYYEAYVRRMFASLQMPSTGYLPNIATWPSLPPTRNDTWYRHAVSQGYVDDENAFALGGIAGHAGIYSTLDDITTLLQMWQYGHRPDMINSTTRTLWTTEYDHRISCRALGWSTNDLTVPDGGWDGTCGNLSNKTFLHVGFTGTQICADPVNQVYTVLLTNRVYPTGDNIKIQAFRKTWNDAIANILNIKKQK